MSTGRRRRRTEGGPGTPDVGAATPPAGARERGGEREAGKSKRKRGGGGGGGGGVGLGAGAQVLCVLLVLGWPPVAVVTGQGRFPKLENVGAHKPVSAHPARATCGQPERTAHCQTPATQLDLLTCAQLFCVQDCPYRSPGAPHLALLLPAHQGPCVTEDGRDPRPGAPAAGGGGGGGGGSRSVIFRAVRGGCVARPPSQSLGPTGAVTLTGWIKPEAEGQMTVIEKSSEERLVFLLTVSESTVSLHYGQPSGRHAALHFTTRGRIAVGRWTHLALQVHGRSGSLFLDGLEEDGTPFDTQRLTSDLSDVPASRAMWIGLSSNGTDWFMLFMFLREVVAVFSGLLPHLHTQTQCLCPPSHPRVHPLVERYCIPNAVEDTTNNRVLRLNLDAHPLSYVNDQDMGTAWVSATLAGPEESPLPGGEEQLHRGLSLTIDLLNGQYQVFYVIVQFVGPQPEGLRIQRRSGSDPVWRDWQYLARRCSLYALPDNGPLQRPDSVNCLTFPSMLTPEPNLRPGYNDFYNTPALRRMVQATQVRIHLTGQYHTREAGVSHRHRYYGISEITISGRCECHGHADHCDTSVDPYRCLCVPESHTEGHNPFRAGDQLQSYSCRPCQCHGHALSCHYDDAADAHPEEHYRGGGGVCDHCMHNTTGRYCEVCRSQLYRVEGADPRSEDVCRPCDCNTAGTLNGSLECEQLGGQCRCKGRVSGRRCERCVTGSYHLAAWSVQGCEPCNCSAMGTARGDLTCHQDTGQCHCKPHVVGRTCDRCDFGFKWSSAEAEAGCVPCDCDPLGSLGPFCDPEGGQCVCAAGVGGSRCDACTRGLYGLLQGGSCTPCLCSPDGSVSRTDCHPVTGQCVCKCPCSEGVEGAQCNRCAPNHYNVTSDPQGSTWGCASCACEPRGTVEGSVCDGATGQCVCVPARYGRDCGRCRTGFFLSSPKATEESVCEECDCHPVGGAGQVCDGRTGQCVCAHPSVGGRRCDQCQELYYGFNPGLGRCQACHCDPRGSLEGSCQPDTGRCPCKGLVAGDKCDACVPGAGRLEARNHLGCSKAPSQQPPPVGSGLTSTSIRLSWSPPDSPNTHILNYTLYRDGAAVYTTQSHYPFSPETFLDSGLSPFTDHSYGLLTENSVGQTSSTAVIYRTLASLPEPDQLHVSLLGRPGPTSAAFNWTRPQNTSGPLERFVLTSVDAGRGPRRVHYSGLQTEATATELTPYTHYTFTLEACTSAGCTSTPGRALVTAPAPPRGQPLPRLTARGVDTLLAAWDPPDQPNGEGLLTSDLQGIIVRYELLMQGPMESQENTTSPAPEQRVFVSSGWLDPSLPPDSPANQSALPPPESSAVVTGLQSYSTYQLRVLTVNMAGSVASDWASVRTLEGVPEFMPPPEVTASSAGSLKVTWRSAQGHEARGVVTHYQVNLLTEQSVNPFAPPVLTQVLHTARPEESVYVVEGLRAYSFYTFTVTLCTRAGCVSSQPTVGQTLPAAPAGLSHPRLRPCNETTMEVLWDPPTQPNGPPALYQVERTDLSLSDPSDPVVRGTRFPGNGYYRFPSDTLVINSDFTGLELSFRTKEPDGLLLCAISPGNQEEYVALQIQNGRPYFLFDPQGSAVAVGVEGDGGRKYNDGQWHVVLATRKRAVGTLVVDHRYRGNASGAAGSTIIGETTGVFIGGLPRDFALLRQDMGDTRLAQQGFTGCLRDVKVMLSDSPSEVWEPLDWSKATEREAAYEGWEGCPAHLDDGAHFLGQGYLELSPLVFEGGEDFEMRLEFRTDQLNALLVFAHSTHTSDFLLAELEGGLLSWLVSWGGHVTELSMWVGLGYCDGDWSHLSLAKRASVLSAAVSDWSEELQAAGGGGGRLSVDSPLYLGGVPSDLAHPALEGRSHKHSLGGCVRRLTVQSSSELSRVAVTPVRLSGAAQRSARVCLDGCPTSNSRFNCRGNDSVLVYTGKETRAWDNTLQPYTEYLYRVVASAAGGWTAGPWERGRSRETGPSGSGFSAQVSWAPPSDVRGVIDRFELRAYNKDDPDAEPVSAAFLSDSNHTGLLTGLSPFTRYVVTVTACTHAGCTESRQDNSDDEGEGKWTFVTPEEAASFLFGVLTSCSLQPPRPPPPPVAEASPTSLFLTWDPPARPNGVITDYLLYHNHRLVYSGNNTHLNLTGLGVYSAHVLVLGACTAVGCTNSSKVTLLTSQNPPGPVDPPALTVLDSRSIYVQWSRPTQVNGMLEFYSLYQSSEGEEPALVYNSMELFEDHTLRDLTPGTAYSFTLAACTGGGCTLSPPSEAHTEESTPENVPAPTVTPLSPHALNVSWGAPHAPNGVITSYGVWMNGVLVQNSSSSSSSSSYLWWFAVEDLSPWSLHSFRIQACTAQGCGLGPLVSPVFLELTNDGPRSLRARWTPPPRANGNVSYSLLYTPTGSRVFPGLLLGSEAGRWVSVDGLQPFTNYTLRLRACNSQGCVESDPSTTSMPPTVCICGGVCALFVPSSLQLSWSPPVRANSPGPLVYSLQMRALPVGPIQQLIDSEGSTFTHTVEGLSSYTDYQFRVITSHTHGETTSQWTTLRTAEDHPHPHNVTLSWAPPSQPNGVITSYTLHLSLPANPTLSSSTHRSQAETGTRPYRPTTTTSNGPGTILPPGSSSRTDPATSSGEPSSTSNPDPGTTTSTNGPGTIATSGSSSRTPSITTTSSSGEPGSTSNPDPGTTTSNGPDAILLPGSSSRTEPVTSSGEPGSTSNPDPSTTTATNTRGPDPTLRPTNPSLTASVPGNITRHTLVNLQPFTIYSTRVEVCTSAGCTVSGPSRPFRTPPAPPEGVPAPHLYSDTPTSVLLSWGAPERSNGELEGWVVERRQSDTQQVSTVGRLSLISSPSSPLSYLDSSSTLSPWTSYQYRLSAHNQAGSTAGPWVSVTTRPSRPAGLAPPQVLLLGTDSMQVTWSPPLIANGEIDRYEIRLPEPRVARGNASSELAVAVTGLVPYTDYSVTVLACSSGGGHVGGCTESPPTRVTTLPSIPQGLGPLAVVAVSESFLAVSWQPPARPNGPRVRYELRRRKTQQPLSAARRQDDLHLWFSVYSGPKLFHQDKGLSRFTWYQYQLLVHNDVGHALGELVTAVTMAGVPLRPPLVWVQPLNHTAIQVNWTQPTLEDLQGEVEAYTLRVNSTVVSQTLTFPPGLVSVEIGDLRPSTFYSVSLQVSNGAHNISSTELSATTPDGEPEGVYAPEVVPVNNSAARVLWSPPLLANGAITGYGLYLDDRHHGNADNTSGSYLLGGLLPYTVYHIQVEVCTVYACVKSNSTQMTTVEDAPSVIAPPHTQVLGPRSVRLDWSPPGRPSGILLGYELLRRTLKPCGVATPGPTGSEVVCTYLQCSVLQGVCGRTCYQPDTQVCCDGRVHDFRPQHLCCQGRYLPSHNSSHTVCCGDKLLPSLPEHQCCGGFYVVVASGEVCCPDPGQGRVAVGLGDACCGGLPYSSLGGQLCCSGLLHDSYGSQCCGGRLEDDALTCCGDAQRGTTYTPVTGLLCCGEDYINSSTSLCCGGQGAADAPPTVHPAGNATVTLQCCGSEVITQEEQCCSGAGYRPDRHVCAGRPTPGLKTQVLTRSKDTAYCGTCDLDPSVSACTWVLAPPTHTPSTPGPPHTHQAAETPDPDLLIRAPDSQTAIVPEFDSELCPSPEEQVYSGGAHTLTFTDGDLEPFTTYEYRLRAWNSFGRGSSDVTRVTTNQESPWGVAPPRWSRLGDRDDIIQLHWQAPAKPNGDITHYVLLRDGQERYRGDESGFTDAAGIRPFQEYSYQLQACNRAGCADSVQVQAVTVQGAPEGVLPPVVTALGPTSLRLGWTSPSRPNGIVQQYRVNMSGAGTIHTHTDGPMDHTVTGLQPYTDYSFVLVACTSEGCGVSQPSTGRTLEDTPSGVWSRPRHVLINSSTVELFWSQPSQTNGEVTRYRLLRDGRTVHTGKPGGPGYTDTDLQPNRSYVYELEVSTGGGVGLSDRYAVQTPVSSPLGIPPPSDVTVSGSRSISVSWTPPARYDSSQPLDYNVLLNPGSDTAMTRAAGGALRLDVIGLEPFTDYVIRVQACQKAPPEDLDPPAVRATGARVVEVVWTPPHQPNGVILSYHIHRRPMGTEEELLVFIWSNGTLEFIDASDALQPFSQYQYRVHAQNSKGSVQSQWASALTLEAEPEEMSPPVVTPTGAYSVELTWTEPVQPNGLISRYRLVYRKHPLDPTLNASSVTALTVPGATLHAQVFGLEPYTEYSLRVEAVNGAGSVASPWAGTRTLEASPAGLANFSLEQREQGRALMLTWEQPDTPNGVITMYNIYSEVNLEFSGLSRHFLFRRLEPFTVYFLFLEACTSAGCSRTPPQRLATGPAPPQAQPPPVPLSIGPDHVELSWSPPTQPNGPIGEYHLLLRSLEGEEDLGKVLFRVSPARASTFSHTITGLLPWTRYQFRVRVTNPAGHALSPWVTVTTKQAPPRGLAAPSVTHVVGRPDQLLVSWAEPLQPNGVLLSYRVVRDDVSFSFRLDPGVLSYRDRSLEAFTPYRYAVTACTSQGCVTSPPTHATTPEAPPGAVDPPALTAVTAHSAEASWSVPSLRNGEVLRYVLEANGQEVYRGRGLGAAVSGLSPDTPYSVTLTVCTSGGCTSSTPTLARTQEAPPENMPPPTLKVTSAESIEVSWRSPEHPNGVVLGYELRRDGEVVYVGTETRYHDFTLRPSVEYSYVVGANNSRGAVRSQVSRARTHPSAPSGVGPPTLHPLGPHKVRVDWSPPARPNGDLVSYTVHQRDPALATSHSFPFGPGDSAFSGHSTTLQDLWPHQRYEVWVEACTELGCASSDWASVLTLEAPPAGQTAPLLHLQRDAKGMQTVFALSWSPPSQPNGRVLHYELYRKLEETTAIEGGATLVCRNLSTSCRDEELEPYTSYKYQVWAVNSAGHSRSPWSNGRTGPAPPEGLSPPTFLCILATSVVVEIAPPAKPNGIVTLYRVFTADQDTHTVRSEGTSHQQTLYSLSPYTQYWVGVEACTCYQCCSQGPLSELHTQASPPAHQPGPRSVSLTSRSAQVEWDEPLTPNGVIESCELHIRSSCPRPPQPVPLPCDVGPIERCFFGLGRGHNVTGLAPYSSYQLRASCFNSMGGSASNWTTVTTLPEAPQYVEMFSVDSNLTLIWLDWTSSFSLHGRLREFTLTQNSLTVYSGFHSNLYVARTSHNYLSFQVTCTTDSGSASTPIIRYSPATGLSPVEPTSDSKQGASASGAPVYSELWFILLVSLLGLLLLALILGLVLRRALRKSPFIRERAPLAPLQQRSQTHGEPYMFDTVADYVEASTVTLKSYTQYTEGLADTKIVGGDSRFSPGSVLRLPSQSPHGHAYSPDSLHRSVSQLIDRKSLMMEEGGWDNSGLQGHDSGLYVEEEDFVDAVKVLSSVRKEHTMFTDTHL
ncbi:usherin [Aplochiton taeniatus]